METLSVRVTNKTIEAEGIVSFELSSEDGSLLPSFSAGSHIDVYVKPGVIRQYSLCNHPDETTRYLISVLRDAKSRGGSVAMHDEVNRVNVIQISEPRNHFQLIRAKRILLFAGVICVTPLFSIPNRLPITDATLTTPY